MVFGVNTGNIPRISAIDATNMVANILNTEFIDTMRLLKMLQT